MIETLNKVKPSEQQKVRDAISAYDRLIQSMRRMGILFCTEGEVEGFSKEDAPKAGWLDRVLVRDLASDPKLAKARLFATDMVTAIGQQISAN